MKYLKMACLILAGLFLFTSCAGLQSTSKRQLNEPEAFKQNKNPPVNFYVKHNCWKSPFNPHDVLQYWVKVGARQVNSIMVLVIVGNPKIDWKHNYGPGINPTKMPIPKGETASAVVFVFVRTPVNTMELVVFGYKDDLGVQNTYVWDKETNCYERELTPKQQNSCLNT